MARNTVILLDSNNTLYRIYHTQPPKVVNGHRVESANGVIGEALKFLEKENVAKVVSFFDANDNKNFRHELDPEYKAGRSGMPEDLKPQEKLAQKGLVAAGIPLIVKSGFEADDAIGMVANKYAAEGFEVVIVTTDKDMGQLVSENIHIYNPVTKKRLDAKAIEEKMGVMPEKISHLLAIMGDKSDDIPGIDKVGIKTAAKLINQFGSIEGVVNGSDQIKGMVGQRISDAKERLKLNLKLTTILSDPGLLTEDEKNILNDTKIMPDICSVLSQEYGLSVGHLATVKKENSEKKEAESRLKEPSQGSLF